MHRGWIALDIDGTITDKAHHVPPETVRFLTELHAQGWQLMFITGRTFSFGTSALNVFDFPYYLGVQNGADILEMPSKKLISRAYLPGHAVSAIEKVYQGHAEDYIVYSGYETGDFCYYRPQQFSQTFLDHLVKIEALSPEPWKAVSSFDFTSHQAFPLIKCLGLESEMRAMNTTLLSMDAFAVSLIRDPMDEAIFLNLVTHPDATKGKALERMIAHTGKRGLVIAAGDDLNDVSMIQIADIGIVMNNAPKQMHPLATILAEPAHSQGIIAALTKATAHA